MHSERPKLHTILAFLSALGSTLNPNALRKAKIAYNFGLSECIRVKGDWLFPLIVNPFLPGFHNSEKQKGRQKSCFLHDNGRKMWK